jgi:hypothetical protein
MDLLGLEEDLELAGIYAPSLIEKSHGAIGCR